MQVDESLVTYIATTYYNLSPVPGSIHALCGYSDKNFMFTDSSDDVSYVLKIVNKDESIKEVCDIIDEVYDNAYAYCKAAMEAEKREQDNGISFVVPKLIRTTGAKLSTFTSVRHDRKDLSKQGQEQASRERRDFELSFETVKCNIKLFEFFHGATMSDYINFTLPLIIDEPSISPPNPEDRLTGEKLYRKLGRVCNELFVFLRTQRHLIDQLKSARDATFPWQLRTCEPYLRQLIERLYPDKNHVRRVLVEQTLDNYNQTIKPRLEQLPEFILHGDLSTKNFCYDWDPESQYKDKICLIDFQDLQAPVSFEETLKLIPRWIYSGYQSNKAAMCSLEPDELNLVPGLMKLRLCQSLLNGQVAFEEDPSNKYVMESNMRGWTLLELMSDEQKGYGNAETLVGLWLQD